MPAWLRGSRVGKRLTRALEYVVENGATTEYREYLQTLADRDADRTHANYTLIRFVVRVTPVLGFLGTVVHFGTALNGVVVRQHGRPARRGRQRDGRRRSTRRPSPWPRRCS